MGPVPFNTVHCAAAYSLYSIPFGIRTITCCSSSVAGIFRGADSVSRNPGTLTRALRRVLSNCNVIGTNWGSCIVVTIDARTSNQVFPPWPLRIVRRAFRCSSEAFLSMKGWTVPFPSCSAPGHEYSTIHESPSRLTVPKFPSLMYIPAIPSQPFSGYGKPVVSQGHAEIQLQFLMYCPFIRHATSDIVLRFKGKNVQHHD